MRVFALAATEPFRTERDPRQVSAALGANQIVDATVERRGDEHRIKVRLIDGNSAIQLWSGELRGPASELIFNWDALERWIGEVERRTSVRSMIRLRTSAWRGGTVGRSRGCS